MRLIIRNRPEQAAQYIADYIVDRITTFAPTQTRPFVLGLPTGSSPLPIYNALIHAYTTAAISFRHVVTFNMDEYVGLPRSHPQSYRSFMFENFFRHVDIQPENVHILNGNAADLVEECRRYETLITSLGGIELFLGGVGRDGHIAFNEPGSSLCSRTRVKSLAHETIVANARFFNGDVALVPRMALTVGVQTIMDAREVVIIATGGEKALAVAQGVEGGVSHLVTLSALQMHPRALVVVDEEATGELRVKTVRYFVGVERTISERPRPVTGRTKLDTSVSCQPQDGELTPDSMSSRIESPRSTQVVGRPSAIPFELDVSTSKGPASTPGL
ncbi:putative glucosamine-6-phosphate isomerase [Aspergillus californicus]